MSQRECAGFNWPGDGRSAAGVSAEDPLGVCPESASCACRDSEVTEVPMCVPLALVLRLRARNASGVPPASWAAGVAQGRSITSPSEALGVGHDARAAAPCSVNWTFAPLSRVIPSGGGTVPRACASGVGQWARNTWSLRFDRRPSRCFSLPPPAASFASGVAQWLSLATSFSGRAFSPCLLLALDFQSRAAGVGHAAVFAAPASLSVGVSWFPLAYE